MGFVALIFALLLEQGRPLSRDNPVYNVVRWMAASVRSATDAGSSQFGMVGWLVIVGSVTSLVLLLHWFLGLLHPLAVFVFHVIVLYCTVGFRQFSHAFSKIQVALAANDLLDARQILERWLQLHESELTVSKASQSEVCRLAISHAIIQSHRHVFAPLLWYILLPGPIGPVIYRLAEYLSRIWSDPSEPYAQFARRAYYWIDWLPLRLTVTGFAIVGNFEDAVYCWRGISSARRNSEGYDFGSDRNPDAGRGPSRELGWDYQREVLLAAGGGALGLRIADPRMEAHWASAVEGESGFDWQGAEPDSAGLRSAVGLVWRAVLLWILLFGMLSIASLLGR